MRSLIFSALICLLSLPAMAQDHLAMITDLSGTVTLVRANGSSTPAKWGTQLYAGDKLRAGTDAKAAVLYQNGSLLSLAAGAEMEIGGGSSSGGRSVDPTLVADVSDLTLHRTGMGDVAALGGLRSGGSMSELRAITPAHTLVRDRNPIFAWQTEGEFEQFTVTVLSEAGRLWTGSTVEAMLAYPESAPSLEPGEAYFWKVEGEDMLDSVESELVQFGVLTDEQVVDLTRAEEQIRAVFDDESDSASRDFMLGSLYARYGLTAEAIEVFEGIAGKQADSSMVHEILGKLYSEAGREGDAVAALQRAIQLNPKQ